MQVPSESVIGDWARLGCDHINALYKFTITITIDSYLLFGNQRVTCRFVQFCYRLKTSWRACPAVGLEHAARPAVWYVRQLQPTDRWWIHAAIQTNRRANLRLTKDEFHSFARLQDPYTSTSSHATVQRDARSVRTRLCIQWHKIAGHLCV